MFFCRKSHYDEDDYLTLHYADDVEEEEDEDNSLSVDDTCPPKLEVIKSKERSNKPPPRRKRKRRKRRKTIIDVEGFEVDIDPDDLPPRARWTIMATACILLAMSLLLVGVTLRMAPIIDEMGKFFFV